MGVLYILAGINHFWHPKMYIRIIPPLLPAPAFLNMLAGLAEILLGIMLFLPSYRHIGAMGIILLLIAVFPANVYMYQQGHPKIPKWVLLLRLPLQGLLIYWAYLYI